MKYEIGQELIQKIGQYLMTKPYGEVAAMLEQLQKLEEIKEKGPDEQ